MAPMPKRFEELLEPINESLRKSAPGYGLKVHNLYIEDILDSFLEGKVEPNRAGLRLHLLGVIAERLGCRWKATPDKTGVFIYRPKPTRLIVGT